MNFIFVLNRYSILVQKQVLLLLEIFKQVASNGEVNPAPHGSPISSAPDWSGGESSATWRASQSRSAGVNGALLNFFRWEAIWVQAVSPTVQRLLGYDQAPAHPQRSVSVPVHHLPGLLPEPGRHAEAHEGPQARGGAGRLEDRKDLPVRLLRLSRTWTPRKVWGARRHCWGAGEPRNSKAADFSRWKIS